MAKQQTSITYKVQKEKFVYLVVFNPDKLSNYEIAGQIGISIPYFYTLQKKYAKEIETELRHWKNALRLKAFNVIYRHLEKDSLKAAELVLKTTGDFIEKIAPTSPDRTEEYSARKYGLTDEERARAIVTLFEAVKEREESDSGDLE